MKWFGDPWGAPVNRESPRTATPTGSTCWKCDEEIVETDRGYVMPHSSNDPGAPSESIIHHACFMMDIMGPDVYLQAMTGINDGSFDLLPEDFDED